MSRRWHRPWLCLLTCVSIVSMVGWLVQPDEPQVLCRQIEGSPFHAAVEMDCLYWTGDLNAGLACARKHDRKVLLAFHAVTDTNACYNERYIFTKPDVKRAMKRYVLVMLHIDWVPPPLMNAPAAVSRKAGQANFDLLNDRFGTLQEPLYAVLAPTDEGDFRIVGIHDQACLRDSDRFERFLHQPQRMPNQGMWRQLVGKVRGFFQRP